MERRVLLAIFLCFLVLYVWQATFGKPVPKPGAATSATASQGTIPATGTKAAAAPGPVGAANTAAAVSNAGPTAAAVVGETSERDIRVETNDVIAVFTNRGARLKSWQLKHYFDHQQHAQELVEQQTPNEPLPFTLTTPSDAVNATINQALYTVSGAPPAGPLTAPIDLTFEYRDSAGVAATKTFHLEPRSYVLTVRAAVTNSDRPLPATIVWGPAIGDLGDLTRGQQASEGLLYDGGKPVRLAPGDIAKQPSRDGTFGYAGVDDNYFITVALAPGASTVTYRTVSVPPPPGSKDAVRTLVSYSVQPKQPGGAVRFVVGPKDLDILTSIDRDLSSAINFGRFSLIVVPLLRSLKWVHSYVGNWGWSIVILTMIISAILSPLQHTQVKSMRKMQEIQPEIKAIQDRYSKLKTTDPAKQKMNQEMMALYREKKVNPASGCVPMLLTFPVLFAMWALLQTSIELRGAPWFGWIHDLSTFDPYYVLPVLMTATSFWQTKMTPAAGADPAQQKMMMFMPLVMGFIFIRLPAGALIYYVVSNAWRIGQQYLTNYLIGPPIVRTVRPAAERRMKRVGAGKAEG